MTDQIVFDSVILIGEEDTDEDGRRTVLGSCGYGEGWFVFNEELDVLELERCQHCVCSAFVVLAWL